jgi:hypothetical protein
VTWGTRDSDEWSQVVVARRPAGGHWSAPKPLGRRGDEQELALAATPGGQVTALWIDDHIDYTSPAREYGVVSAHFDGTSWSAPVDVWRGKAGVASPRLSVSASGGAVATWVRLRQRRPWALAATAAIRGADGTWQAPHRLDDGTSRFVVPFDAGIDDAGNATVVWTDQKASRVTRWDGTAWDAPHWLAGRFPDNLDLVVNGDGSAAVAFVSPYSHRLKCRLMDPTGTWTPATEIVPGREDGLAELVSRAGGGWAVLSASDTEGLRVSWWDGGSWQLAGSLATDGYVGDAHLLTRADGDLYLVWNEHVPGNATRNQIRAATLSGGVWSSPPTALSGDTAWLLDLRVASNDAGHVVAVWDRASTIPDSIMSSVGTWGP